MNDQFRTKMYNLFYDNIQGGVCEDMLGMIDRWIEEGEITQEDWDLNELAICNLFDENWFMCDGCGWTLPIEEECGDWRCNDCQEDD